MSATIILVRHGHSVANRDNIFAGQTDVELTPTGMLQAQKMAEFVLKNYKIDSVYASTLQRAWKTAELIASPLGKTVTKDKRLCEIFGGKWDGMSFGQIEKEYPNEFDKWQKDLAHVQLPGGENAQLIQKRGLEALREIARKHDAQTVAVVCHRVVLRTLQCAWENRPIEDINKCGWLSNCSVNEILIEDDKLIPIKIGQDEFLGDCITRVTGKI